MDQSAKIKLLRQQLVLAMAAVETPDDLSASDKHALLEDCQVTLDRTEEVGA